jgi:hypothetical protein
MARLNLIDGVLDTRILDVVFYIAAKTGLDPNLL